MVLEENRKDNPLLGGDDRELALQLRKEALTRGILDLRGCFPSRLALQVGRSRARRGASSTRCRKIRTARASEVCTHVDPT